MKPKKVIPALMFAALGSLALTACNKKGGDSTPTEPPEPVINVSAVRQSTDVKDTEVETFDYTSLFTITSDGESVTVLSSYVDSSAVTATAGEYDVTCTYEDVSATTVVNVVPTVYTLELSQETVSVLISQVPETNFSSYFTAKTDGTAVEITSSMVISNVVAAEGNYTYTVTHGDKTATLNVKVIDDVTIVPTYALKELEKSELGGYDYTELFSLYVDGEAVRVTNEMLDKSTAASATVGQTFDVTLSYVKDGTTRSKVAKVKVVADRAYTVSSRNIVTYPHGDTIDLTSLFTIKHGDEDVAVTPDMISGEVDYTKVGSNTITLSFNGATYTATVEVKYGVIIDYASSDSVIVKKGTAIDTYAFAHDFKLIINGIRFYAIPDSFFEGLDTADFDTVGEYDVKLKVPYSKTSPGITGARFEYTELAIKYVVVDKVGEVKVVNPTLTVAKSAGKYNVFNNLMVTVDGRRQSLTSNPDYVTPITCYAQVLSDAIDFTKSDPQSVRIAVYVYGNDKTPITVEYTVVVRSNVVVTPIDKGVFTGETVFTKDLFTVTEDGQPVTVTNDMISGKADTFNPGVYDITLEYGGVSGTAKVTVFDNAMKGTYKTKLTTVPVSNDDDEDDSGDIGWGDGGEDSDWGYAEYYGLASSSGVVASAADTSAAETSAVAPLGDFVISDDGSMKYNGMTGEVINGIDESTLVVKFGSDKYTLHYDDGIIVLDPDNSYKLGFGDHRRPLVFFNSEKWDIGEYVTINYGAKYVLSDSTMTSYSIDTFKLTKKADASHSKWFALYVELAEKTSSDTVYIVEWGEAEYAEGFTPRANEHSSITFNGETYNFTMSDSKTGKVDKESTTNPYAGKTFVGTVNGKTGRLVATAGGFEFSVNGVKEFSFTLGYDLSNTKNAYIDSSTNTVFLYKFDDNTSAKFSYKFLLDPTNNSFTIAERDEYYGLYYGKDKYIYVDGYGTGIINFNSSNNSSTSTQFRYTVNGSILYMTYFNVSPTFAYGAGAEFYVGEFLNTLTTKMCAADGFAGETLENSLITDGAIVKLNKYEFAGARDTRTPDNVKAEILDAIKIITKDGELVGADKEAAVNLRNVSCNSSGYYLVQVNLTIGSTSKSADYAIQITTDNYSGNPLMISYGKGELSDRYTLVLDGFGRATLDCGGVKYIGYATPDGDSAVFVKVYSESGGYITATVERIANGIVKMTAVGTESFTEYFTTGTSRIAGIEGTVIREFTVGSEKTFILAGGESAAGSVVTAEYVEGTGANDSVIKITDGGTTKYYKIIKWDSATEGIMYLPNYTEQ